MSLGIGLSRGAGVSDKCFINMLNASISLCGFEVYVFVAIYLKIEAAMIGSFLKDSEGSI
jgi:hypothetical protein